MSFSSNLSPFAAQCIVSKSLSPANAFSKTPSKRRRSSKRKNSVGSPCDDWKQSESVATTRNPKRRPRFSSIPSIGVSCTGMMLQIGERLLPIGPSEFAMCLRGEMELTHAH